MTDETAHATDHYLPLAARQCIDSFTRCCARDDGEQRQLARLAAMLEARFHFETHRQLRALRALYDQLDPDVIEATGELENYEQIFRLTEQFMERFERVLRRANYRKLDHEEIEKAAAAGSDWGVNAETNLEAFDYLLVFARGSDSLAKEQRRRLQPWKKETVTIPLYERLVVAFSLKPGFRLNDAVHETAVYLKLFKEIPHADVNTLLPSSTFRMSWLDRTRIALPTLSGLGMAAAKIVKGSLVFAWNRIAGIATMIVFVGGTLSYGVKSFLGYLRAKDKYQLTLTRSLYYQNLDNNAGVLFRLLDEAEQQDFMETLLAYGFLWNSAPRDLSLQELDEVVESFLARTCRADVDFEVDDAMDKVARLGMASETRAGKWRAVPLTDVLEKLADQWEAMFDFRRDAVSSVPPPKRRANDRSTVRHNHDDAMGE